MMKIRNKIKILKYLNRPMYYRYYNDVIKKNEIFLLENVKDVYDEVTSLKEDAEDILKSKISKYYERCELSKHAMGFYVLIILVPHTRSLHENLLSGNLSTCFVELRFLLESLVKCYLADLRYAHELPFDKRIKMLEDERRNITKLMEEMGKIFGSSQFKSMWETLSDKWVHTRGHLHMVNIAKESEDLLASQFNAFYYKEGDIKTLIELKKDVARFRNLLKMVIDKIS